MAGEGRKDEKREEREAGGAGFRVVDRRGRTEEEPAAGAGAPGAASRPPERAADGPRAGAGQGASAAPSDGLPAIDFSTFVVSLATSTFHHLGLAEDPETGRPGERNLPLAQQTIDLLELLQQKTRGNLDADEARLLDTLLYELRLRFVEASR